MSRLQQSTALRAQVRTVPVYATVLGPDGRLLTDLTEADFEVRDDGQRRPIAVFSNRPVPIAGISIWDVSNSMIPYAAHMRAAARAFVEALWPGDRFRIGSFGNAQVVINPLLTDEKLVLRRIVDEELWFGGGTPLWSALAVALGEADGLPGRRVLVVATDGEDPGSWLSQDDFERQMQRADVMVYALGFEGAGLGDGIRDVAEASGGGYVELPSDAELSVALEAVVNELHHQYLLGFTPIVLDGRVHTIEVHVRIPGAKVRARRAYVADGGES